MFYFVTDIVMCVFWGLLISLILTGGLFYLPKLLVARYRYTPLHIGLLSIAFCFLLFQSVLLVGGFKVKGYIPSARQMEQSGVAATQLHSLSQEFMEAYPMLKSYIPETDEMKNKFSDTAEAAAYFTGIIHHKVNLYIWRRIGWIAGALVLFALFFINDSSKQNRRKPVETHRRRMPD